MTDLRKRAIDIAYLKTSGYVSDNTIDAMLTFREEGVKAERERCAKVCKEVERTYKSTPQPIYLVAAECAEAIEKGLT